MRRAALALALAAMMAGPGDAAAQTAAQIFRRAVEQFATADFQGSVASLERARGMTRDAELLGQIHLYLGANRSALGQPEQARRSFHQALVHAPELELDPARFKAATVELFRSVRAEMRGTLQVSAGPRQGRVFVDGRLVGTTPRRVRLHVGVHPVEVRGPDGGIWYHGSVVVGPGQLSVVEARSGEVRAAPPADERPTRPRRLWTWIAGGGAVVSLGAAVGLVLAGWSDNKKYRDAADEATAREYEDSGKPKQLAGQVLFGVAGALAVTSVVLYLLEGRGEHAGGGRSARLAPLVGQTRGLALELSF